MPGKLKSINRQHVVEQYSAGASANDIGREFGISQTTVFSILRQAGVPTRLSQVDDSRIVPMYESGSEPLEIAKLMGLDPKRVYDRLQRAGIVLPKSGRKRAVPIDDRAVTALYAEGIGTSGIAERLGCSRQPVIASLKRSGIPLRNRTAQQVARMKRATPEQRKQWAAPSHVAARGSKRSLATRCMGAASREKRGQAGYGVSDNERALGKMLTDRGLTIVPQKAIGPYNCDIAVPGVAVEIFGGYWHWYGAHAARLEERFRYILDAGWNILVIPVNASSPLTGDVADYAVAYSQETCSNPPAVREYRMVWRAGEIVTAGRADDDKITLKRPAHYALKRAA